MILIKFKHHRSYYPYSFSTYSINFFPVFLCMRWKKISTTWTYSNTNTNSNSPFAICSNVYMLLNCSIERYNILISKPINSNIIILISDFIIRNFSIPSIQQWNDGVGFGWMNSSIRNRWTNKNKSTHCFSQVSLFIHIALYSN